MDTANGFYNFPIEDSQKIRQILENKPLAPNGLINFSSLFRVLETHKIATLVRLVQQTLISNPQSKVIVYVKFIESMRQLAERLNKFNPILMTSRTSPSELELFNRPTNESRLIIGSLSSLDLNVTFDDQKGSWPRTVFLTKGVEIGKLETMFKSPTVIRFIFDKQNKKEIIFTNRRYMKCPQLVED